MRVKNIFCLLFLLFWIPQSVTAFTMNGFQTPAAVVMDPDTGDLFVSNVEGSPTDKDGMGFISRLTSNGKPIDFHFIRSNAKIVSLDAPKGMALLGDNLYVTDIDRVHRFNKNDGRYLGSIDFTGLGVHALHALAKGPGDILYVSDTTGHAIYEIDPGREHQVTLFLKSTELAEPTGLLYDTARKRLLVLSWKAGKILFVDQQKKIYSLMAKNFRGLEGVGFDSKGNLVFSALKEGKVYRLRGWETLETVRENLVTPAGIFVDSPRYRVVVPSFRGNIVFTVPLAR